MTTQKFGFQCVPIWSDTEYDDFNRDYSWLWLIPVVLLAFLAIAWQVTSLNQERLAAHLSQLEARMGEMRLEWRMYRFYNQDLSTGQNEGIDGIVTAYTARIRETDNSPCVTADGTNICESNEMVIANNCLAFDTIVQIDGMGYRVADRMNSRYGCDRYDILVRDVETALNWGVQKKKIIIY